MCDRCEELELEVEDLKVQLELKPKADVARIFAVAFKLTPAESNVLALLHGSRTLRTYSELEDAIRYDHAREYSDRSNVVSVYLSKMRTKFGTNIFECYHRVGYRLTEEGRALCDEALDEHARGDTTSRKPRKAPDRVYRKEEWIDWREPERAEILKQLHEAGRSLSQIAAYFKTTRSSVSGAVHRHVHGKPSR